MDARLLVAFCQLALQPLPVAFIGPLAAALESAEARADLFILRGTTVAHVASTADIGNKSADGLAYVVSFKSMPEITTRYWISPSLPATTQTEHMQRLLAAAATTAPDRPVYMTLSALPTTYVPGVETSASVAWTGELYEIHEQLDAMPNGTSRALGVAWRVGDDDFVVDALRASDAPRLIELATVDYKPAYIEFLANHPTLSQFARVVRLQKTCAVVSSCVIHRDFSLGLVSTDPAFLRRGLANEAVHATLEALRGFLNAHAVCKELRLRPHCAIKVGNTPSARMMAKFGFRPLPGAEVLWMGVHV
ncbi:hypothetical protein ACHHYP_02419 [Achlya hypogyna]|uniref:N-acetyltransferase domain-containing protein n=1 Tax=Achlya hypogyna TaxID=1202772 RepID=A0A1V9Z6F2_ACHHY|nr:hypothetical protein ACHHYP_02419 [Achlya hypogyna]